VPRGSERVQPGVGRHKAARPPGVGPALLRALVATLVPALLLGVGGWVYARTSSGRILRLATDPAALLWLVAGMGVVWLLWVVLIWRAYARLHPRNAAWPVRFAGTLGLLVLIGAVSAPMAVGTRYAVVQRDLIGTVFSDQVSATAPKVSAANPWGKRARVNVLLLGGDGAVHRPGVRTDSVILASIDTATGRTVLFSLPRNLRNVPFRAGSKLAALYPDGFMGSGSEAEYFLNAVYRNIPALHPGILGRSDNEGADAVKLAVAGALGLRVDYYVLVNLSGFQQLVDAIGGITVNINEPVPIGGNTDAHIPPDDYLQPGPNQRLNGFKALWYTRGRYGSTDYKRMERQRCAINAIAAEASPTKVLRRYTRLAQASKEIVRTDIPHKLLPAFVELAGKAKLQPIKSVSFERSDEFDPNAPDFDYVRAAVREALKTLRKPASTQTRAPTPGGATPTPSDGSTGATASTDAVPSKLSDATQDCAYRPVAAG
jgi:polyisoprenyl-teichoic acid--peptidoglycan teichoic acid transferase